MPKRFNAALEKILPEKRIFLKSDSATRVVHLRPATQLGLFGGTTLLVGWAIISGALLAYDRIGGHSDSGTHSTLSAFETRLAAVAGERDARANEAKEAQLRFAVALDQVSKYQTELLAAQQQNRELAAGLDAVQQKLGTAMADAGEVAGPEMDLALNALNEKLRLTAEAREAADAAARLAKAEAASAKAEQEQMAARNEEIFTEIEDAALAAALPYQEMLASLNLDTDALLKTVDAEYSGQGGPLTQATVSTSGNAAISKTEARAKEIVVSLDQVNRYKIASNLLPLDMPVKSAFRYTSGFGARWGRAHKGIDLAGPVGTAILATGDGTVKFAGRQSGYGNVIIVEHALGTETRYAHLSKIRVQAGQKVSRGSQIGDMGNTGRSTGPHLHYEVRVNGEAVNPMSFIKAAQNVF
ncbi:MAG: M23 family metallopeptidase [Paracoccus denitrificans]|uniref:M23 family metallopeptidase n=1 Tax=Paracoccus denitrificans TaxID=266 RepID=A0A533IB01_PARDE|nr:MAG: M23 family metallopeptidase [Paracoccus denitrificans]